MLVNIGWGKQLFAVFYSTFLNIGLHDVAFFFSCAGFYTTFLKIGLHHVAFFFSHVSRMANPSPLTILLRFLQPGLRRRRGHARILTLHQNIIDDISAINQCVKPITSASSSYFGRIVATLSTN